MQGELMRELDEIEARLRAFGAPIADAFRACAPAELVRRTFPRAHEDAVAWWGWHDGAETDAPPGVGPGTYHRGENTLLEPSHVLSIDEARRSRDWLVANDPGYDPAWTPILDTDGAGMLCADTDGSLLILDEGSQVLFASLRELAQLVVRAFDEGAVGRSRMDPRAPAAMLVEDPSLRRLAVW